MLECWQRQPCHRAARDRGHAADCFKLGYALGKLSSWIPTYQMRDFDATIVLTRDVNNVPIVQMHGKPVS
jgi:hypothetical protein